jgi:hypothetical protein
VTWVVQELLSRKWSEEVSFDLEDVSMIGSSTVEVLPKRDESCLVPQDFGFLFAVGLN